MTLEQLDQHIAKYLKYLKDTNALRNINELEYKITHSTKSQSLYVKLRVVIMGKSYNKVIRFSDHPYVNKNVPQSRVQGLVLKSATKHLSKKEKKRIEATIRKGIRNLLYGAGIDTVYNFKG